MTAASLTERYIAEAVKSLPPAAQEDVRAELEASIGDAVEARLEQGEDGDEAERAVLNALGDPGVLAAGYADRPLHLIGPRYYLVWRRLLKLLLIIVPICAVGGSALGQVLADASAGEVLGSVIGVGISSIVHVAFWVTLAFFVLERTGADAGARWSVDRLPEPGPSGTGRADLIASLVLLALAAGALLWDRFRGFARPEGEPLAVLDPGLWPWPALVLIAVLAAEAALAVAIYVRGRWSIGLAIANTVLGVLFAGLALSLLVRGELVNPEFIGFLSAETGVEAGAGIDAESLRVIGILAGLAVAGITAWDVVDGWLKTARARRG
jgi:hypothetical protein